MTPTPTPVSPLVNWINDCSGEESSDIAIFRSTSGLWAIRGVTRIYYEGTVDLPVRADYRGTGGDDLNRPGF